VLTVSVDRTESRRCGSTTAGGCGEAAYHRSNRRHVAFRLLAPHLIQGDDGGTYAMCLHQFDNFIPFVVERARDNEQRVDEHIDILLAGRDPLEQRPTAIDGACILSEPIQVCNQAER
jgi:hypothetical protein